MNKAPLRLISLSDGLFATVLTLLVLDLRMPDAAVGTIVTFQTFARWLGPHLFSYLLTFFISGIYWLSHHRYFDQVTHYDSGLLRYNLIFLLFIGLFPFSTILISGIGGFHRSIFPFYWAIYAGNILAAGLMLALTWNYAVMHGLVRGDITRRQSRHNTARIAVIPSVFLVSIVAEFLFPQIYLGPYILAASPFVMWIIDQRYGEDESQKERTATGWRELMWRAGTFLPWLLLFGVAVWCLNL